MKLSLLFAAAFAVACPPPFNDVRFMANDTVDSATLVRNYLDALNNLNPNLDWFEKVSSGAANQATTWPARQVHGQSLTIIYWCLADETAWLSGLDAAVNAGWNTWENAIGPADPDNRHNLVLMPLLDAYGNFIFCYIGPYQDKVWNNVVPKDTLAILPVASYNFGQASATAGYFPDSANNQPGRHALSIGHTGILSGQHYNWAPQIAHELGMLILFDCKIKTDNAGHVFGLLHEHQRPDRDQYVYFDCTRVQGYWDLISRLQHVANAPSIETLCNDKFLGSYYNFPATEFSTQPEGPQGHWSSRYDINSIMHYPTAAWAVDADLSNNHGPLLAWKEGGDLEVIHHNFRPSSLDGDAIRRLYPWTT
jgi:hypothetical protein